MSFLREGNEGKQNNKDSIMDPTNDKGRPEKGYHGYRSRDDRSDRERSSYGSSSQNQGERNPFSGNGNGGGYRDNYNNGGDNGRDRYSGNGNGNGRGGGNRDRDRYGDNGRGRGNDQGYGGSSSSGNRHGTGDRGQRDRSYGSQGSYERRSGSGDSNQDAGVRKRYDESPQGSQFGVKRSPPDESGPSKRPNTGDNEPARSSSSGVRGGRGRGGRTDEKDNRPRRDRYAIIQTKPETFTSKEGTSGEHLRLTANYFELIKKPAYEMVMYRVDFEPECEMAPTRKYLMYTQRDLLGAYLYDTQNSVYLTHRLVHDVVTVETMDNKNTSYKMTIRFGTIVSMDTRESLQVLNLILRRSMEGLNLQLIGRNLFDPLGTVNFNNFNLQLWPGYTTSIRQHDQSILLCVEIASKVMRNETIYDVLRDCHGPDHQNRFSEAVLGLVVLTDYNNKTYRIDDIDFAASPSDTFETKTGPISFVDYYRQKYNITIRNPTQPMLITRSTDRQKRGGESETISLIPELCRPTGLTEKQRNDFRLMKAIAEHTRMDPRKRMCALDRFNKRLQSTPASQDILRAWNVELSRKLIDVDGRKLKNENIIYGNDIKEPTGQFSDWQMAFRDKSMFLSYPLRHWVVLAPRNMQIKQFIGMIQRVSSQMHFEVKEPIILDVDDKIQSYGYQFEAAMRRDPQLVMAFVNNNNADKYLSIKKMGCCTHAVPTQVIVQKTLNNKGLMSIATKVAIQMNCKIGGTPWMVTFRTKGLMTVGIDVSRDSKDRNVSWGALVATMDLKSVSGETFFSTVSRYSNCEEFSTQIAMDMTKLLKAFQLHTGAYPDKIVIYRDGVGDGQIEYVLQTELQQIKEKLEQMYNQNNLVLKFVFIIVSKKINTRIFGRDERNPPSGTVVDSKITLPERHDFYLISQTVRQGTVSPTSYHVIYNSLNLSADRLQLLTYQQCHIYYNWAGTVRVPAVCQNAHKLSSLVAQFLHQVPSSNLEKKLYFL